MALSPVTVWLVVAGVAVGNYALRSSFLLAVDRFGELPPAARRVLPFVPVAVLAALLAPDLFVVEGAFAVGLDNPRLVAGAVAFLVAWYTESILATVGVGMVALWALLWVVP